MSALGKAATQVPTSIIVFFQNFIALMLLLPWILRHGISGLKTSRGSLHVLRAVTGLLSQALMFVAVKSMPLMNAVLLSKSTPLFIPLIAGVWLRKKIDGVIWISLAIGFVGIILILKPTTTLLSDPTALVALSSAIFSALSLVSVNRLSNTEPTERVLFYYLFISSLLTAPFAAAQWRAPSHREWIYLVGIGIFMTFAQLLIIFAYHHASASRIAPFNYSVVVFSGIIGWVVWKHAPGLLSLAGVILVIAGGVLSTKFGGPEFRGHFGWIGYWNHRFHVRNTPPTEAAAMTNPAR